MGMNTLLFAVAGVLLVLYLLKRKSRMGKEND